MKPGNRSILYIDDDPDDREMLSTALSQISPTIEVVLVENGLAALTYLNEAKMGGTLPCLIVLDINMPVLDGKQTLKRIRDDASLKALPVLVFTSSQNPNDKSFFHNHGVTLITKPASISYLRKIAENMLEYCS